MPRDGKNKTPSEKTAVLRAANELTEHVLRKLCNEKLFPRRSRWLMSGKLADLVNDFYICVNRANEIRVITPKERDARHYWQTMAMANLNALDAKMNLAARILSIDRNEMEYYTGLVNECKRLIQAWMNSDIKRYGSPTGLKHTEGDGQ